jgi:hypothetical protein
MVIGPSQGPPPDNTQHSKETEIPPPPRGRDFFILLYSVLHRHFCLCLDCPAFCLLSLLTTQTAMSRRDFFVILLYSVCRSQWPSGLRRGSAAARLLGLRVRIQPRVWLFVCCECCLSTGRGLCDGLITRPEEFYRLWCVIVCDLETSRLRRLKPASGLNSQ